LQYAITDFICKATMFSSINLPRYSAHKSIKVQLLKNEKFTRYFIFSVKMC